MFQLYHDHKSMNSFRTYSSVTNSTTVNGPCLEIGGMKPLYKAITPSVLTVFMAHPSPIQNSIIDSIKAEQRGWWWFTWRTGAARFTRRAGAARFTQLVGAERFLVASELSRSLSLSLPLKEARDLILLILFFFFSFFFFSRFFF